MKILFLGTGPAQPLLERRGKSRRKQSAALVTVRGFSLLIDAGLSISKQLPRYHVSAIDTIVLTHRHADAAGGIQVLDHQLQRPTPVFVGPREAKRYRPARFTRCIFHEWQTGHPFLRQPLSVTAFRVRHAVRERAFPTHGLHIRAGRVRVTYASDLKTIPRAAEKYFRNNDLLIVDGAGWKHDLATHRGILNHVEEYTRFGNARILFTQIGRPVPPHAVANRQLRRLSAKAALAYDGLRVNL